MASMGRRSEERGEARQARTPEVPVNVPLQMGPRPSEERGECGIYVPKKPKDRTASMGPRSEEALRSRPVPGR